MNKKNKKLIDAFNKMEESGSLPLFDNEHEELDLHAPIQLDTTDINMVHTINVAVAINNCLSVVSMAKRSAKEAFKTSGPANVIPTLESIYTELLALQANTMRHVTKHARAYTKAAKKRKTTPQKYEKTTTKTKTVS